MVVATFHALGFVDLEVIDDDPTKRGRDVLGVPVTESISGVADRVEHGAFAAIGDNRSRKNLVARLHLDWISAIHPEAIVHPSVAIGPGSIVCAGAVIQPETRIGRHVIINTGASVDHDCDVGDFAHIAPGARIAGGVHVGTGTLIGIGSAIIPGVVIGKWTTVGAGAAVTEDLPDECTAAGVPARVLGATP